MNRPSMLEEEIHSTLRRAHKKINEGRKQQATAAMSNRQSATRFACNDDIASSMYRSTHGKNKNANDNRSKYLRRQFNKMPLGSVEFEPIKDATQVQVGYIKSKNFELAPYARKITTSKPVYVLQ